MDLEDKSKGAVSENVSIPQNLIKDVEAVQQISIVPTMLEVVCQITGMGFAAIARVTEERWLACSVRDEVEFGLEAGGELEITSTICNEIRDSKKPVVINHVEMDAHFRTHHTPKQYGFQSYISVPIILKNGSFFGTLCAIDPQPADINNKKTLATFTMFADLISFHLQSQELLDRSLKANSKLKSRNDFLTEVNNDLDTFVYTASHDLRSPINNIEGLLDILADSVNTEPIDRAKVSTTLNLMKISLNRLGLTIQDLATIVETEKEDGNDTNESFDIFEVVDDVQQDLSKQIEESDARIIVESEVPLNAGISRKNFKSILYNLVSNSIKYRSAERIPEIIIRVFRDGGRLQLSISDNGMGIPPEKKDKVFNLFNRFHKHVEGSGIGLYIVKRMLNNAKAGIKVDSVLNEGTTFTISF